MYVQSLDNVFKVHGLCSTKILLKEMHIKLVSALTSYACKCSLKR